MSGVYISGMEMPKNCIDCAFGWNGWCHRINSRAFVEVDMRRHDCPLVPVPDHGRLVDADALHKLFEDQWHYLQVLDWNENPTAEARQSGINWCINTMHDDAPTIIPADMDGAG